MDHGVHAQCYWNSIKTSDRHAKGTSKPRTGLRCLPVDMSQWHWCLRLIEVLGYCARLLDNSLTDQLADSQVADKPTLGRVNSQTVQVAHKTTRTQVSSHTSQLADNDSQLADKLSDSYINYFWTKVVGMRASFYNRLNMDIGEVGPQDRNRRQLL